MSKVSYPLHEDEHVVHPKAANIKKDCPYCKHGESLLYDDINDIYLVIDKNKLSIEDNDDKYIATEINFCPKCGDKL